MTNVAIRFDHVSKCYRLQHGWDASLRDSLARYGRRLLGRRENSEMFWALRDVSFDVHQGETVGVIGSNGAGKSTTLKILSRVTVPTSGSYSTKGRVGALIEVGAGFHPDLTGRENVYLNGSIMGMKAREIEKKFDQIVAFSEVEKFIDTPLKFYSSGMMVRLGFSVAAHIEPEILLVDEVLAVGDTAFQTKCMNKIAELKAQDKTIVLVSHSMASIMQHSSRVLWIDYGTVKAFGDPEETIERYLRHVLARGSVQMNSGPVTADSPIRIVDVSTLDGNGKRRDVLTYGQPGIIEIGYEILGDVEDPVFAVAFHDVNGHGIGSLTTRLDDDHIDVTAPRGSVRLKLDPVLFTRGTFSVTPGIYDRRIQHCYDVRPHGVSFMVDGPSVASREVTGHFVYPHSWETAAAAVERVPTAD